MPVAIEFVGGPKDGLSLVLEGEDPPPSVTFRRSLRVPPYYSPADGYVPDVKLVNVDYYRRPGTSLFDFVGEHLVQNLPQ